MKKERQRRSTKYDPTTPAAIVVEKFGGLQKMSRDTGISGSTIYGWLARGRIRMEQFPVLLDHAARLKVKLKPADFVMSQPEPEATPE